MFFSHNAAGDAYPLGGDLEVDVVLNVQGSGFLDDGSGLGEYVTLQT